MTTDLVSKARHNVYGGDAYTGIQNAAADTENAVIASANAANELASQLHRSQMRADATWWAHVYRGLAVLIVVIAGANFVSVLQRFGMVRRQIG